MQYIYDFLLKCSSTNDSLICRSLSLTVTTHAAVPCLAGMAAVQDAFLLLYKSVLNEQLVIYHSSEIHEHFVYILYLLYIKLCFW